MQKHCLRLLQKHIAEEKPQKSIHDMHKNTEFLIALDLDGTSVIYEPGLAMHPGLTAYLASLRDSGIAWVMNSDRYTSTMAEIAGLLPPEQKPAGLLSCQRFIHLLDANEDYLPVEFWNREQTDRHSLLWKDIEPLFPQWKSRVEGCFTILEEVINDIAFAYRVEPRETPELRSMMQQFISGRADAQVSGNHDWTFILHADFSKSRLLKKAAKMLGVTPDHVIAVGDGINDLSMLDGSVTSLVGCPANASEEVKDTVSAAGGIIAQSREAEGTMEIIKTYLARLGLSN